MELVRVGRNPDELAEEFEPSAQAIRNWVKQADLDQGVRSDGLTTEERDELQRLRRENKQLKMEREILKKGQGQREMSNKHKSPGGYGIYMRVLAAFPFLMGACVGEPHDTPLADASYGQGVCGDAAPATSLGAVAMVGSSPHVDSLQIGHPAGLALIDSTVYVLDGAEPTIRFFDSDLNYLGRFVGRGGGPGEMLQFRTGSAVPDYLAVAGEQLVVLDYSGDQTLSFSADGKPRQVLTRNHTQYGWRAHTHKRMRWSTDTLFFGGGSYYPIIPPGTKERPVFHVRAVSGGKARTLAMLPVHAVPRTPSGAFMVGPAEAVVSAGCNVPCSPVEMSHF